MQNMAIINVFCSEAQPFHSVQIVLAKPHWSHHPELGRGLLLETDRTDPMIRGPTPACLDSLHAQGCIGKGRHLALHGGRLKE